MTKVQTNFKLSRPLADHDLQAIARMHSIYGFLAIRVQPSGDEIFVEYDFSRLSGKEVRGAMQENGLPIV